MNMAFKFEELLISAGIDTRGLAPIKWPGSSNSTFILQGEGSKVVGLWERLRSLTDHIGFWPLVAGDDERLDALRENCLMELESTTDALSWAQLTAHGETLDLELWYQSKVNHDPKYSQCEEGLWPQDLPRLSNCRLALAHKYDYRSAAEKPLTRVNLLLLPVTVPWQAPAFLRLGGWKDCPQTEVHIAMLKNWNKRFGAEMISATKDMVEMRVSRPPKTRDEALCLAREQFFYCKGIIDHKYGNLSSLAAILFDASIWSFTWG